MPISRPKTSLPPMATRPKQSTNTSSHRDSQVLHKLMQPVISADLDTIMPRTSLPPTATRPTINQPLIAETNLSANSAEQNPGKAVGQQAVQNLSANELSRTHRPTSCLKPTPHCLQRHRGQTCRTTSCPKPVGQQAVQTCRTTSCLKPTPDCLQRHRGQSTAS